MVTYRKQLMSITELHKENGYPRDLLYRYAHARGAPVIRGNEKGKILFDTEKLPAFEQKYPRMACRPFRTVKMLKAE